MAGDERSSQDSVTNLSSEGSQHHAIYYLCLVCFTFISWKHMEILFLDKC